MSFVIFDKTTGEVLEVGNTQGDPCIEVPFEEIEPIITLKARRQDYKVVYDTIAKRFVFKHQTQAETAVRDLIEVKPKQDNLYDVLVKISNSKISVHLNEALDAETRNMMSLGTRLMFAVTEKDNPYKLIATYRLNFTDENELDFDVTHKNYSIFTAKKFENYAYEVVQ